MRRAVKIMMPGVMEGKKEFFFFTNAVNTSTFDPSWVFSAGGGPMTVDWGDGSAKESHATTLSHTYAAASGTKKAIFSCPDWTKVTQFRIDDDICVSAIPNFSKLSQITSAQLQSNGFSGALPSFNANTKLATFYTVMNNTISGAIPSFSACTLLANFQIWYNQHSGTIPSFATNTALTTWMANHNYLSGSLPSFNACTLLTAFDVSEQLVNGGLTGTLPSFAACIELLTFSIHTNAFSGTIPSFATNTKLTSWRGNLNLFTGYEAGGFATQKSLATLNLQGCRLTSAAVDAILADLVTSLAIADRVTNTVTLGGLLTGLDNGVASAAGTADIATLKAAGWTVLANEAPNILIFGDSISTHTSWPVGFRTGYKAARNTVTTLAVGGATVVQFGAYGYLAQQVASSLNHDANIVVVLIGVNDDAYQDADFRVTYQANLANIITANPAATVYCLGILDCANWVGLNCAAKNALIQTAATNVSATYIDTTGWIDDTTDTTDGLHPNAGGKTKIINALIAVLPA